jgi:hypothetical protein
MHVLSLVQVLLAGADPLLGIPDDMCFACPYQDCQVSAGLYAALQFSMQNIN